MVVIWKYYKYILRLKHCINNNQGNSGNQWRENIIKKAPNIKK